jgi:hypothetical protein
MLISLLVTPHPCLLLQTLFLLLPAALCILHFASSVLALLYGGCLQHRRMQ